MMMGAAFFSAVNAATTAGVAFEAGVGYSTSTTNGGLVIRDDSPTLSVSAEAPVSVGTAGVTLDLSRVSSNTETDILISWGLTIKSIDTEVYFAKIDSSFGNWEEVGVSASYSFDWFDVGASLWHELGSNADYGMGLSVSRKFETPVAGLTAEPFVTVNFADSYTALEAGVSAEYVISDGVSVVGRVSFGDNDADGGYALDNDWAFSAGLNYKF
tara:strand:+ start:538 stop:1179 length:642 start_codon:yes stop_codon:yes gene_type:complete